MELIEFAARAAVFQEIVLGTTVIDPENPNILEIRRSGKIGLDRDEQQQQHRAGSTQHQKPMRSLEVGEKSPLSRVPLRTNPLKACTLLPHRCVEQLVVLERTKRWKSLPRGFERRLTQAPS